MKKNDYLLLSATAAYSFLFYHQTAGLNYVLFNLIFLAVLLMRNIRLLKYAKWLWAAGMCVVSSVFVFIHSSDLSIIANIFSLLLVSAFSVNIVTSSLFSFFMGVYSVVSSVVHIILDSITRQQHKKDEETSGRGMKLLALSFVVILSLVFFAMYQAANPLFAENTKWINLDFISLHWLVFTGGGFVIVYGLFYHKRIIPVERWENTLPLNNALYETDQSVKRYETEQLAGVLLFVVLNLMLLILNIGDINTLYLKGGLPKGVSHSDFVHNGVGVMILSIIMATGLMMFLFRKEYTSVKYNRMLIIGVYAWIIQNLLMLSSTVIRNQMYIHDYNLTYKRIGVYVWLTLAVIGLLIMFWKIYRKHSNWYLIKTNVAVWFTVLALSSTVNWDGLITDYNLKNKPLREVDLHYLFSLSDTNIPEMLEITKDRDFYYINSHMRNYTGSEEIGRYYQSTYIELLRNKIYWFLRSYNKGWKSFDLREQRNYRAICGIKD